MVRDDFKRSDKLIVAARAGFRCSNPQCGKPTAGPAAEQSKSISIGVAAHITAASLGGPRYDPALNDTERSSITNAIWLCADCHRLVDSDPRRFTASKLREWKASAERFAFEGISIAASSQEIPGHDGRDSTTLAEWDAHKTWSPKAVRLALSVGLLERTERGVAFSDRFLSTLCSHGRNWATDEIGNFLRDGLPVLLVVAAARSTLDNNGVVPLHEGQGNYLFSQVPYRAALHMYSVGARIDVFRIEDDRVSVAPLMTEEFIEAIHSAAREVVGRSGVRPLVISLLVDLVEARVRLKDASLLTYVHILALFVFDRYDSMGFVEKNGTFS